MPLIRSLIHWRPRTPFYYGWLVLGVAAMATIGATGVAQVVLGGIQDLIFDDMGWERSTVAYAVTAGHLDRRRSSPPFVGRLADRYGPRWMMPAASLLTGVCLFTAAGASGRVAVLHRLHYSARARQHHTNFRGAANPLRQLLPAAAQLRHGPYQHGAARRRRNQHPVLRATGRGGLLLAGGLPRPWRVRAAVHRADAVGAAAAAPRTSACVRTATARCGGARAAFRGAAVVRAGRAAAAN